MNPVKAFFVALSCISIVNHCFASKLYIRKCKLTHSGIEYRGNVFTTKFKSLCRPWNSIGSEPDSNFADGSKVLAKNFCRNPNGTRDDLWCYTYNENSPVELCAVPLCYLKKCRMTGPGVEYGGNVNVTKSGYTCSKWSDVKDLPAADSKFPDGGRSAAGNRCRNPTGDPGGPWCYASVDGTIVPDYCDTSGCDDGVCHWTLINGGGTSAHGHYTAIPISDGDDDGGGLASFELKTWDPAVVRTIRPLFRVSLTAYPTGSSTDGFEVPVPVDVFTRSGTAQVVRVDVSWRNGFVVLTAGNPSSAREVSNFELNATLSPVAYLSFTGGHSAAAPVAIRFAHCDLRTAGQEEHVTNSQDAYRIFPLKKTVVSTSELSFSVRAVISASVTYYTAPARQTPRLIIDFAAQPVQQIKIFYIEKPNSEEQIIFNQSYQMEVISYWKWHQYKITIADKTLQIIQVTNEREKNPTIMLNITDFKLRLFHWFAIGSKTVAHWTLYCSAPEFYPLPVAALPECVISESGENYRGSQWITGEGDPCVPWNVSSVRTLVKESALIDQSYAKAKNYCRNPTKDPNGPYCYVAVGGRNNSEVEKRSCRVRKCQNTKYRLSDQQEYGLVSDKTAAAVRRLLAGETHNEVATVGDRLTLLCDRSTMDAVRADSPNAQFGWLRNGKTVTSTVADDDKDRCTLVISSCTTRDSGVYAFVVQLQKCKIMVLKLFAVAINDEPISVYIGDVVRVQCTAATLSSLFEGMSKRWLVNDSFVIKNYEVYSLASIDVDTITIENKHFQGIWKCIVKSTEINSTWVTNIIKIKVRNETKIHVGPLIFSITSIGTLAIVIKIYFIE